MLPNKALKSFIKIERKKKEKEKERKKKNLSKADYKERDIVRQDLNWIFSDGDDEYTEEIEEDTIATAEEGSIEILKVNESVLGLSKSARMAKKVAWKGIGLKRSIKEQEEKQKKVTKKPWNLEPGVARLSDSLNKLLCI